MPRPFLQQNKEQASFPVGLRFHLVYLSVQMNCVLSCSAAWSTPTWDIWVNVQFVFLWQSPFRASDFRHVEISLPSQGGHEVDLALPVDLKERVCAQPPLLQMKKQLCDACSYITKALQILCIPLLRSGCNEQTLSAQLSQSPPCDMWPVKA